MPQALDPLPFQIDHIIAEQHGGQTSLENCGLACLRCNKHKGPNIAGIDPHSGKMVALFHPRLQKWDRHFQWLGARLVGRTQTGRATIAVLAINDREAVSFRKELIAEGLYPRA